MTQPLHPWHTVLMVVLVYVLIMFVPLPCAYSLVLQVAKEYDAALVESKELPRKPAPPAENEEADE